jgi:hypothetical protein
MPLMSMRHPCIPPQHSTRVQCSLSNATVGSHLNLSLVVLDGSVNLLARDRSIVELTSEQVGERLGHATNVTRHRGSLHSTATCTSECSVFSQMHVHYTFRIFGALTNRRQDLYRTRLSPQHFSFVALCFSGFTACDYEWRVSPRNRRSPLLVACH